MHNSIGRSFESMPSVQTKRLYTTPRKIDAATRGNVDASFRRLLSANPATVEFNEAYDSARALDPDRAYRVLLKRFAKLQKSKAWPTYERLRDEGNTKLPDGFLWMRRLEELTGYATQIMRDRTAQKVRATCEK